MVYVKTECGGFHEPPYTEDEILEAAQRFNGGVQTFKSLRSLQSITKESKGA